MKTIVELSLTTAIVECVVAAFDTPFLYLARRLHAKRAAQKGFRE